MADSRTAELERKLEETRDLAARGFQALSRDISYLQRDVSEIRRLLERLLGWVGSEANPRRASSVEGEARLVPDFEVRPGSFASGYNLLRKEFDCDLSLKNIGTAPAEDFQVEVEFPADYADIARSPQFFLRKKGEWAVFRVRESNYPNERMLPGRDVKVLTIHYFITPQLFHRLSTQQPRVRMALRAAHQEERIELPLTDLVQLSPNEMRVFSQSVAELRQASGA